MAGASNRPNVMPLLRKDPDSENDESYVVLCDGRYVGRIFYADAGVPKDRPWFWGVEFHEWQGCKGPQYGNAADREAAIAAFKATWESR